MTGTHSTIARRVSRGTVVKMENLAEKLRAAAKSLQDRGLIQPALDRSRVSRSTIYRAISRPKSVKLAHADAIIEAASALA